MFVAVLPKIASIEKYDPRWFNSTGDFFCARILLNIVWCSVFEIRYVRCIAGIMQSTICIVADVEGRFICYIFVSYLVTFVSYNSVVYYSVLFCCCIYKQQ